MQQAPPAIILAVLCRFLGPALFRGLRPSSRQGVPFWPSGLTLRSSGPAFCGPLTLAVRPRIQIPMIPNFFTNLSVRLHPFRRALIAGLLFVISAIFAFVFLLVVPGRVALPTLMLFAVPLLVILWASICCASWFHPEHGRLSINRFSGRKQPAAVQSFARWYAATFLVIFVLAGVLGPLVLFR